MGVVYEAYDRELEQPVALKTLQRADGRWLARFKREFRSLHDLAHPNLVSLGELFDGDDADPFFTMELVDGVDFLTHVRGEPAERPAALFDEDRLRAALEQLAAGIAALHAAGKVHRDIKPSNIMVAGDDRVVLLDFGLVAELRATSRSLDGAMVGTAAYMAPEQAMSGEVSPAADWYSLGVVLFEALTGALPHDGETAFDLIIKKQQVPAEPPRKRAPATPPDLDELCAALLQQRAESRPGAREIFARLGIAGGNVGGDPAPPEPDPADPVPFVGRDRELAALRAARDSVDDGPLVFLVEGVSGVGKTHLVERFLDRLAADDPDTVILTGRCYEREVVSFKAFDGIADSLARYLAHLPRVQLGELMPARPALLARLFPILKRVAAIASAKSVPDVPDPHDQRQRMFGALRELFLRLTDRHRLVWYIDDLQWTDADSLVLLADLLAHEERLPVFIVATMRPVDDPARRALLARLEDLAPIERLQLDELSRDEARELAEKLLPGGDRAKLEAIAADAGGHPLLLHELAHHAATTRGATTRGTTLDEMLAARIGQLDEIARRLLEVVAVFGGPVTQEVAMLAADLTGADRGKAANSLRAAHLVRTDGVRHHDRIVIYHDRVREHLDAQLDAHRKRRLHDRLAVALEQTGAAEHEPRALVRHARAAGRTALAADYARAAARRAVGALAFDQAAEFFADAIELGDHDPDTTRALQLELATALMHAGRGPEAAETFMAAADGADPAVRLDCQRQAAHQWIITGHLERGMAAVDSSLADIGEPPAASPRRAVARVLWNRARLRLRGTRHKTRRESQIPVETLRRLDVLRAVAHGLAMVDNIRGADFNGRFLLLALRTGEAQRLVGAMAAEVVFLASQGGRAGRRARRLYQRLVRLVEEVPDDVYARTWLLLADGASSFFEGRFRRALEALDGIEAIFAEGPQGLTYEKNNGRVFRVHTLRMLGALRQHDLLINELVRSGRQRGDRYLETTLELLHGQSLLARGEVGEVRRAIDEATWTPPEHGYHLQHWYELLARAELALYTGDAPAALDRLAGAFADLDRSMLLRVKLVRCDAAALRGRLLVAAAAASPRPELTREAAAIARKLEREKINYATVFALLLRAGLASVAGDDDAVVAHLRRAIDVADDSDMALQAAAARAHLGARLAGDDGATVRAAAAAYAAEQRLADPAQMFELVAPGIRR